MSKSQLAFTDRTYKGAISTGIVTVIVSMAKEMHKGSESGEGTRQRVVVQRPTQVLTNRPNESAVADTVPRRRHHPQPLTDAVSMSGDGLPHAGYLLDRGTRQTRRRGDQRLGLPRAVSGNEQVDRSDTSPETERKSNVCEVGRAIGRGDCESGELSRA